jgi:hypothetical protein
MEFEKSKLKITPSSFKTAKELERSIGVALNQNRISLNLDGDIDLIESSISGENIGELLRSVLNIAVSREVEENLFKCCERAIYDNEKINIEFFEKVENRSLYYPIMIEIIKVNVYPFIESLFSQFGALIKTPK